MHPFLSSRSALIGGLMLVCPAAWGQAAVNQTLENARRVGSLVDRSGELLGTCFFVDSRGLVATAFSNVERATEVAVVFNGRREAFPVVGFANASRGKDIVILAVRGLPDRVAPLNLRADASLAIGENLLRWGGPAPQRAPMPNGVAAANVHRPAARPLELPPLDSTVVMPKVVRSLRGDEYALGARTPADSPLGRDPDTHWLWLDQPLPRSCAGGPLFDRAGDVVAMSSGALEKDAEVFSAVHIKHVLDLIPPGPPKLRGLNGLKDWEDPLPTAEAAVEPQENDTGLGGKLTRGLPLVDRFRDLQRRLVQAEREEAEIAKTRAKTISRTLELAPQMEQLAKELSAVIPEEEFVTTETRVRRVRQRVKGSGPGDKDEFEWVDEEYDVRVTRRRLSERQRSQTAPVEQELAAKREESLSNDVKIKFLDKTQGPFLKQLRTRLAEEVFYVADPLGLRSPAEHAALAAVLTESIEEGGAPGIVYLLRATARTSLGEIEAARLDLAEAVDADPKLKMLSQAVEARCKIRSGENVSAGIAEIGRLLTQSKNEPQILMLAARCALDRGTPASALRYLASAETTCPDPAELHLASAWMVVTGPSGNNKAAIEHAEAAVRLSAGRDWNALAALAAAQARAKDFDRARVTLDAALRVAPESAAEQCREWQTQIADKRAVKRDWK